MLALDPFYEMFPTTYRPSYPWWRYSWAGLGQLIPTATTPTVPDDLATARAAIEAQCPTKAALCANPSTLREDVETLACCFFNSFKANDVQAGRNALGVLDATKQAELLAAVLARFPESADFIKRVQGQAATGLSTCVKIAIGAVILGAVGVTTIAIARRR
jgi:hypothetical protein